MDFPASQVFFIVFFPVTLPEGRSWVNQVGAGPHWSTGYISSAGGFPDLVEGSPCAGHHG